MDIPASLAIVALAALIHASFQVSVSVLTLLSGHALGSGKARRNMYRLTTSYLLGAVLITILLVATTSLIMLHTVNASLLISWAIACGLALGIGIAVWLFYYRKGRPGTELWVPRSMADHLQKRSQATKNSAEAFSLGLTGGIAEIIFTIPSLVLAGLSLISLPSQWQLLGMGMYALISSLGLVIIWGLVSGGHSISQIQKWREKNKHFLQFAGGSALIVLSFFVYVSKIAAAMNGAM